MNLKIHKHLKRAELADLFSPNENIIENNALFFESQLDGKFHTYFTNSDTDHCELYVKFTIGMVYVLNFGTPDEHDLPIKLQLQPAEAIDIKDGARDLKYNKVFYKKKEFGMEGPFFLSPDSNPIEMKELLQSKKMYVITRNQKIESLTNQNIAV